MKIVRCHIAQVALWVALLFISCTAEEVSQVNMPSAPSGETPITFSIYVSQMADTRAGAPGQMDNAAIQSGGFGVFAHYTAASDYADGATLPNFMYNQQVNYDDAEVTWSYAPVKYWPNDFSAADVDVQGATGSEDGGKVSFFAYAPYTYVSTDGTNSGKEKVNVALDGYDLVEAGQTQQGSVGVGITALTTNAVAGDPCVTYRMNPASPLMKDNVDLLWGVALSSAYQSVNGVSATTPGLPPTNLTKPTVAEAVQFQFLHALSQLRLLVQGAFDDVQAGGGSLDGDTRILVNSITVSGMPTEARLNLNNTVANRPRWQKSATVSTGFVLDKDDNPATLSATIRSYTDGDAGTTADIKAYLATASNFDLLPQGVTQTAVNVVEGAGLTDDPQYGLVFIPASTALDSDGTTFLPMGNLTVTIDYDVITRDPSLVRNVPAGFSIISNHISRTLSLPADTYFEAGKKYTLKVVLGMTTVKFEVLSVEDYTEVDSYRTIYFEQQP